MGDEQSNSSRLTYSFFANLVAKYDTEYRYETHLFRAKQMILTSKSKTIRPLGGLLVPSDVASIADARIKINTEVITEQGEYLDNEQ